MGGMGSGRNSGRPVIERGLKLDLRSLRRQRQFVPDGIQRWFNITWSITQTGERTGSASIEYCAGRTENWLRLRYSVTDYWGERTDVNETFQLVSFPQPYGGYRWYFICPSTNRRCQCLYRPPGATRFRSRQGFKVRLLYYSQTQDRATRLMETGRRSSRTSEPVGRSL